MAPYRIANVVWALLQIAGVAAILVLIANVVRPEDTPPPAPHPFVSLRKPGIECKGWHGKTVCRLLLGPLRTDPAPFYENPRFCILGDAAPACPQALTTL